MTTFLDAVASGPAGLLLEGEPGIGKTTLWLAAIDQARERGFRVLSARPVEVESQLAHASVADVLRTVDADVWTDLPDVQRRAVDQVLLRDTGTGSVTDQHAVGAALLSVLERLADVTPVLVAVDDLQWMDRSSVRAIGFAARRLAGQVGVLAARRAPEQDDDGTTWLRLDRPERVRRVPIRPLARADLRRVLAEHGARSAVGVPMMTRIQRLSGGNPLYALELARAAESGRTEPGTSLPATLAALVRDRIAGLDSDVRDVLLAVAVLHEPTVELVEQTCGVDRTRVVELLQTSEESGVITIDGHRLRFRHPLLAEGVYRATPPTRRRAVHRRVAEVVDMPELRARHLALSSVRAGPETFGALDAAAVAARHRGAPDAAAELLGLAVGLGGDSPERLIRLASHRFDAGDSAEARTILEQLVGELSSGPTRAQARYLLGLVRLHDDSYADATALLEQALGDVADDEQLRVRILVGLSYALANEGRATEALGHLERAVEDGERLADPQLVAMTVGMRAVLRFLGGEGLHEPPGRRTPVPTDSRLPIVFDPITQDALLLAWTGDVDQAAVRLQEVRQRCQAAGAENDLIFVEFHRALVESWRGNVAGLGLIAEDTMDRATLLGGDVPGAIAQLLRTMVAAYAGQEEETRSAAADALARFDRSGWRNLSAWAVAALGFLEVSLGRHQAALALLDPMLDQVRAAPDATEICSAAFLPDAVEALVGVGREDDAEAAVVLLERNGRRLDRAWMLAVGARGRSMLQAARGQVDAAEVSARRAMAEHARVPMPFERARTQLLLGQLQRRLRRKSETTATLHAALATFEELDMPLWAARARAELSRVNVTLSRGNDLTASERRVAELAAGGLTNREVAATLFISPKTVEANLAKVYRKLNIRSRAELGWQMAEKAE